MKALGRDSSFSPLTRQIERNKFSVCYQTNNKMGNLSFTQFTFLDSFTSHTPHWHFLVIIMDDKFHCPWKLSEIRMISRLTIVDWKMWISVTARRHYQFNVSFACRGKYLLHAWLRAKSERKNTHKKWFSFRENSNESLRGIRSARRRARTHRSHRRKQLGVRKRYTTIFPPSNINQMLPGLVFQSFLWYWYCSFLTTQSTLIAPFHSWISIIFFLVRGSIPYLEYGNIEVLQSSETIYFAISAPNGLQYKELNIKSISNLRRFCLANDRR